MKFGRRHKSHMGQGPSLIVKSSTINRLQLLYKLGNKEPYRGPAGICPPPRGTAHWWGTIHPEELWSPAEGSPRGEASQPRGYPRTVCGGQKKRLHGQTRHAVRWWRTLKSWQLIFACPSPSLDWWVMNDMIHYIPDNLCLWIILSSFYIWRQLTTD